MNDPRDIATRLIDEAAQENHDGPEYDLMQEAGEYIRKLETKLRKTEVERDELERKRGCIRELFLDLDEMEQESKEFHELLQKIFDASVLGSSSKRLLQELDTKQRIEGVRNFVDEFNIEYGGEAGDALEEYSEVYYGKLRKELESES